MKVYLITEGAINTGHEISIKCICAQLELAEKIQKAFDSYGLYITELEVIE